MRKLLLLFQLQWNLNYIAHAVYPPRGLSLPRPLYCLFIRSVDQDKHSHHPFITGFRTQTVWYTPYKGFYRIFVFLLSPETNGMRFVLTRAFVQQAQRMNGSALFQVSTSHITNGSNNSKAPIEMETHTKAQSYFDHFRGSLPRSFTCPPWISSYEHQQAPALSKSGRDFGNCCRPSAVGSA